MGIQQILQNAKDTKSIIAGLSEEMRQNILRQMASEVLAAQADILAANAEDLKNAQNKIAPEMLDRLRLDLPRIKDMAAGLADVAVLPAVLGKIDSETTLQNGLRISKVRVPMGVIAIVYESRPNVTTDAAALCIKSGNVCILRGGSDAINTNKVLAAAMHKAITACGAPASMVQLVEDTTHESVNELMVARGFVDLLIPRGGKGLIEACVKGARGVPVIETGTGICHLYIDQDADLEMAIALIYNAKTSRPSVCNSAEVCLVHKDVAQEFLPKMAQALSDKNVELRLDPEAIKIIPGRAATPQDFDTEFLDFILAVKLVPDVDTAIQHINEHSTGHSDAIVTKNAAAAQLFLNGVDSAAVYWNASTRFTDGGVFGFGCEMGISTQKLGARGPMGLHELTSYKYKVEGTGQTRE